MSRPLHRCDECGKRRVGVTVVEGRDLCPACVPPLEPSQLAGQKRDLSHYDPLIGRDDVIDYPRLFSVRVSGDGDRVER